MFQHDMAYGDFKDLAGRTSADRVLRDKAFNISKIPEYNGYQCWLDSKVYKFFDKRSALLADKSALGEAVKIAQNKETNRLDNIWGADLTYVQLLSKLNKGIIFYCVLLIFFFFTKCFWVFPLKDKKKYHNYWRSSKLKWIWMQNK